MRSIHPYNDVPLLLGTRARTTTGVPQHAPDAKIIPLMQRTPPHTTNVPQIQRHSPRSNSVNVFTA